MCVRNKTLFNHTNIYLMTSPTQNNYTSRKIMYWIHFYGYVVLAAAIYGITVAHLPVILGHQWSVCLFDGQIYWPCVLTIHLYDASLTIITILFAWYSLKRATVDKIQIYRSFLFFIIALELAFFTFECVELLWNFRHGAAAWENYIIASIALVLLGGALIAIYVNTKILELLNPSDHD